MRLCLRPAPSAAHPETRGRPRTPRPRVRLHSIVKPPAESTIKKEKEKALVQLDALRKALVMPVQESMLSRQLDDLRKEKKKP